MFRRGAKLFKGSNGKSSDVFDEAFWHSYSYYCDADDTNETSAGDLQKTEPKKYRSGSRQVVALQKWFQKLKLTVPTSMQIVALLKSSFTQGDISKTFYLIRFFQLSTDGWFMTNESHDKIGNLIHMKGAVNWENVMCYLDALFFSMFANLESFEPILCLSKKHDNSLIDRLSTLLRLYVSLLRSGNLITTDITRRICETLSKLGFTEAMSHKQQDAAALFEFLTEKLEMPLLTFRIDIKHGGKYKKEEDEKYTKERMLFVSVPDESSYEDKTDESHVEHADSPENIASDEILLEECLEHYFNNSVSVRRELERRATLESVKDRPKFSITQDNPIGITKPIFNQEQRRDADQIEEQESMDNVGRASRSNSKDQIKVTSRTRSSTLSIWSASGIDDSGKNKEVSLPAWMFLRLLPFYTDGKSDATDIHNSGARSSKEFVNRRPILPICLKRYSFNSGTSRANKSTRRIVIPPIIDLPQFVADEDNDDVSGEYSLILESAICHRGTNVTSGHFVSAVRKRDTVAANPEEARKEVWYLYDDMKKNSRVIEKSFEEIFKTEWPYMLFYRLVPSKDLASRKQSDTDGSSQEDVNKSIVRVRGTNNKYWKDELLSPIVSVTGTINIKHVTDKAKPQEKTVPNENNQTPYLLPNDAKFIDIQNRYFWYTVDKQMNYVKEIDDGCYNNKEETIVYASSSNVSNISWNDGSSSMLDSSNENRKSSLETKSSIERPKVFIPAGEDKNNTDNEAIIPEVSVENTPTEPTKVEEPNMSSMHRARSFKKSSEKHRSDNNLIHEHNEHGKHDKEKCVIF